MTASGAGWRTLADGRRRASTPPPVVQRRVYAWVAIITIAVVVAIGGADILVSRLIASSEATRDAANRADLYGSVVAQPVLQDALLTGDASAIDALGAAVTAHVLTDPTVVRVKVWSAQGDILYSDEPALIGATFPLDAEEREVLANGGVEAEVSDLQAPENRYERDQGTLLEAYRALALPSGERVLFEVYFRYDQVAERSGELFREFTLIAVGSIVVLVLLLLPVLARLLRTVQAASREREHLLQRSLDASADERRRIAGRLHDGVVQDLVGTALTLSGAAAQADAVDEKQRLETSARTVRGAVAGLRTLLLDIYPPTLERAGLAIALADLAVAVRARGIEVELDVPTPTGLGTDAERMVFRIVRECLGNSVRHARATRIRVALSRAGEDVVVTIDDDGVGFDASAALAHPEPGHLGLSVLADTAADAGARLEVRTAPGAGTSWRLTLAQDAATAAPAGERS